MIVIGFVHVITICLQHGHFTHTLHLLPLPFMTKLHTFFMHAHHAPSRPNEKIFFWSIPSLSTLSQVTQILPLFYLLSASKTTQRLTSLPSKMQHTTILFTHFHFSNFSTTNFSTCVDIYALA